MRPHAQHMGMPCTTHSSLHGCSTVENLIEPLREHVDTYSVSTHARAAVSVFPECVLSTDGFSVGLMPNES